MPRKKVYLEIPFHDKGDVFEHLGVRYKVLKTEGALAWLVKVDEANQPQKGRPRHAIMVANEAAE